MKLFGRFMPFMEANGTGGAGNNSAQQQNTQVNANQNNQNQGANASNVPQAFDYEKLASIINGKQTATEDSVLRGYFKQQGLSKEEMEQAIASFKQQKAAQTPDINAIQQQLAQAQVQAQNAQIEKEAMLQALALGVDVKTAPFLLRMTDLSNAVNAEGQVDTEAIKNALNATLEAVPQLKPQAQQQTGFVQVGTNGNTQQQNTTQESQLAAIFGNK